MRRYLCDPSKNTECRKTSCQTDCFITYQSECKADGEESKLFDLLEELAETIPDYEEDFIHYDRLFDGIGRLFHRRGSWEPVDQDVEEYPYYRCTICGRVDDAKGAYCRWCGSRMDIKIT